MENLKNQKTETAEELKEEVKTFSEEEVQKKIQSENDKVRTEYTKRIKALEGELEELKPKPLTEEEKALQERVQALEHKEKELKRKELEIKVSEILENNGLNKQLGKYLNLGADNLESCIKDIKEIINSNVISNSYQPKNHVDTTANKGITKEGFKKMSYMQKQELYLNNKELYKILSE